MASFLLLFAIAILTISTAASFDQQLEKAWVQYKV